MHSGVDKKDRMTTAELAAYLSIKSLTPLPKRCPLCNEEKEERYKFCKSCFQKGKRFRREKSVELGRETHLKLKREAAKLPAKNRRKSEIIETFLRDQKLEEQKAKTTRYRNLHYALLLKKLEEF